MVYIRICTVLANPSIIAVARGVTLLHVLVFFPIATALA